MPLAHRGSVHPWFAGYGRPVAVGAMTARCIIQHVTTDTGPLAWNPLNGGQLTPSSDQITTDVYQGVCRVQPNQDWRARKEETPGAIQTEFAVRVTVDFQGNELASEAGVLPPVDVGDWIRVTGLATLGATQAGNAAQKFVYVVRNIAESSTPWEKVLLCDIIVNGMTD